MLQKNMSRNEEKKRWKQSIERFKGEQEKKGKTSCIKVDTAGYRRKKHYNRSAS